MSWGGQKLMVEILKVVRYLTAGGAPPPHHIPPPLICQKIDKRNYHSTSCTLVIKPKLENLHIDQFLDEKSSNEVSILIFLRRHTPIFGQTRGKWG